PPRSSSLPSTSLFRSLLSDLSIGQMLAVFSYLWFMIGPVEQLLSLQYAFYAAGGALTRINQLLARADEPQYEGGSNPFAVSRTRSEEHTSALQSRENL